MEGMMADSDRKRKGYQWPALALTVREMEILYEARKETGVAICELIRRAVQDLNKGVVR